MTDLPRATENTEQETEKYKQEKTQRKELRTEMNIRVVVTVMDQLKRVKSRKS